jgi:hypothetical protein
MSDDGRHPVFVPLARDGSSEMSRADIDGDAYRSIIAQTADFRASDAADTIRAAKADAQRHTDEALARAEQPPSGSEPPAAKHPDATYELQWQAHDWRKGVLCAEGAPPFDESWEIWPEDDPAARGLT